MADINLGSIITNPVARKWIYGIVLTAGFILGGIQAYYGDHSPAWLAQWLQVYGYVSLGVSGLALANTPSKTSVPVVAPVATTEVPPVDGATTI